MVFGCSARVLGDAAGADFLVPSQAILTPGSRPPAVIGPLLEEGRARHLAYWRRAGAGQAQKHSPAT